MSRPARSASEGAAGSTFYYVPVAIAATGADGSEKVFAGCYTARLVNPRIQEQPFRPLHIEKGSLKPADAAIDEAVPEQCPDAPRARKADALLDRAKAAFAATHADECTSPPGDDTSRDRAGSLYDPLSLQILRPRNDPEQQARLFRFFCSMGAYNESHIYYLHDEDEGLAASCISPTPELDIRYENDDSEGKVESIAVIGYRADGAARELLLRRSDQVDLVACQMARRRRRVVIGHMDFPRRRRSRWSDTKSTRPMTARSIRETVLDYDTAP